MPDDEKDTKTPAPEAKKPDPKPPQEDAEEEFDAERAKDKISKANREAKALRERLEAAEKRLGEIDDANKSEVQKANDKAAELEKRAQEAESRALRLEIAYEKGLTPSQAKRLVGGTREELEADADELLEAFKPAEPDKSDNGKSRLPKEQLRPGASSDPTPEKTPEQIAEEVLKTNAY